jgi:predicted flap endonuclease-1-like 5' DNA nuclease/cell division protein FtsB
MTWLAAHIWLELLLAALLGGVAGWALRARQGDDLAVVPDGETAAGRINSRDLRELEAQLASEREEVAALRQQVEKLKAASRAEDDEESLAWRNRYLESRVRFLEGKVADLEDAAAKPADDRDDIATRLRWRNTYLEGRVRYLEEELVRGGVLPNLAAPTAQTIARSAPDPVPTGAAPPRLDGPRDGRADDLKRIGGVGPKIEQKLNSLGIFHYDQIAAWTPAEIEWVNREISFKGRIEREKWIEQARALAAAREGAGA